VGWNFRQRGFSLDRTDRHVREVLAGIRCAHGRPPVHKEALLGHDLRDLRDRAILLVGFAGGLRRSEIVGLDHGPDETPEAAGWIELLDAGLLLHVKGKTGWREVEVGRGSGDATCPVAALETWLRLGRIAHGPVFRRVSRDGKRALADRLSDKHVARLVQRLALAAGIRGDLPEGRRRQLFAGHSLRAGLATSAEAEERTVQRHLGHATAEIATSAGATASEST
jgi:site-specific recombinase XerC